MLNITKITTLQHRVLWRTTGATECKIVHCTGSTALAALPPSGAATLPTGSYWLQAHNGTDYKAEPFTID